MAASVTNSMTQQLRDMANQLGFDDVVIHEDPLMEGVHIQIYQGPQVFRLSIMDRNPRAWMKPLQDLSRKIEHNDRTNLDIRHNAVENLDDVQALLKKAHEQNRRVDTMWITPEQKQTILTQADHLLLFSTTDGQILTLFGCNLRVLETA